MNPTIENLSDPEWWDLNAPIGSSYYKDGYFYKITNHGCFRIRHDGKEEWINLGAIPSYDGMHKRPDFVYDATKMVKQIRYQDQTGDDWIDEFARTATKEEFRGAMRFTIGKYNRRMGKKDARISEIGKMEDYCRRWREYELKWQED